MQAFAFQPVRHESGIFRYECIKICLRHDLSRGGTPYNGLYGEAPPERGTFTRLQVYERVGISQVEVYKRVGKSGHLGI